MPIYIKRYIARIEINHPKSLNGLFSRESCLPKRSADRRIVYSKQSHSVVLPPFRIVLFFPFLIPLSLPSPYSSEQHEKGVVHGRVGIVKTSTKRLVGLATTYNKHISFIDREIPNAKK